MRITVRFSARALVGANAALDLEASAARYRDALTAAVAAEYPSATIDVAVSEGASLEVHVDGERHAAIERTVTDLAWAVRQCSPWGVATR